MKSFGYVFLFIAITSIAFSLTFVASRYAVSSEKCIEVWTDEESAEISMYLDGVLVNRRIMLIEGFRHRYGNALKWECNWSCPGIDEDAREGRCDA